MMLSYLRNIITDQTSIYILALGMSKNLVVQFLLLKQKYVHTEYLCKCKREIASR